MKQKPFRKDERLTFRLTAEQKQKLEKLAVRQNKPAGEMVRDLVLIEISRAGSAA
jgi:predicted DNA-binding protein